MCPTKVVDFCDRGHALISYEERDWPDEFPSPADSAGLFRGRKGALSSGRKRKRGWIERDLAGFAGQGAKQRGIGTVPFGKGGRAAAEIAGRAAIASLEPERIAARHLPRGRDFKPGAEDPCGLRRQRGHGRDAVHDQRAQDAPGLHQHAGGEVRASFRFVAWQLGGHATPGRAERSQGQEQEGRAWS